MSTSMQKITPFLWFDCEAEEAAKFYASLFPDSKIDAITRYSDAGPGPQGSVMTVAFQLAGQKFVALNGGPVFHFTEAISFVVNCETQPEIDGLWEQLSAGGKEIECGWVKDKYGLCWQIVPTAFFKMMEDPDAERKACVMKAMFTMKKFDIAGLEAAYHQR
jgi:predicted 3-demethylubiquinone-9 3-methyltransferase (glyoxalase superfamily)